MQHRVELSVAEWTRRRRGLIRAARQPREHSWPQAGRRRFSIALRLASGFRVQAQQLGTRLLSGTAVLVIFGLVLRLGLLWRPGLHPDEALYASWALRIVQGSDPALLSVLVDKPPLQLYLLAGIIWLTGAEPLRTGGIASFETIVRLPALAASVLSLPLLYGIGLRLYGRMAALVSLALYAVAPLAVGLSATAFTDPLLVFWFLLGLWAALRRSGWLTGIAMGLAYATKQQAVLLLPLIVAFFLAAPVPGSVKRSQLPAGFRLPVSRINRSTATADSWLGLVYGFTLIFCLTLWWDSLRWQWMPSYWERSLQTYGGLSLAGGNGLLTRLSHWGELYLYVLGTPLLTVLLALSVVYAAGKGWRNRGSFRFARPTGGLADLLLVGFVGVYATVHLATTIAPWDRYLLPLVPLLVLLAGRTLSDLWQALPVGAPRFQGWKGSLLPLAAHAVLLVSLMQAAWIDLQGRLPVGDASAYGGVASIADYMRNQPPGTVLYHHWLGWHYDLYLNAAPVELRWWTTPEDLAAQASGSGDPGMAQRHAWIAMPAGRDGGVPNTQEIRSALAAAQVDLLPALQVNHADGTPSLTLHRLVVRAQPSQLLTASQPASRAVGAATGERVPRWRESRELALDEER